MIQLFCSLGILLAFGSGPPSHVSCTCVPRGQLRTVTELRDYLRSAATPEAQSVALHGRVVRLETARDTVTAVDGRKFAWVMLNATVTVDRWYYASGTDTVRVVTPAFTESCGFPIERGVQYIFVGSRSAQGQQLPDQRRLHLLAGDYAVSEAWLAGQERDRRLALSLLPAKPEADERGTRRLLFLGVRNSPGQTRFFVELSSRSAA